MWEEGLELVGDRPKDLPKDQYCSPNAESCVLTFGIPIELGK